MTTARGVFVREHGEHDVLEVREHDVPDPGPGEVQVRVAAAGVNFIDVYRRQGIYPGQPPFVLGDEGAGTVTAVGEGVTAFAVGDRVGWAQANGSESTLVNQPVEPLVTVPDGVDLEIAAAALLQGMTAHYLANSTYAAGPGDVALVHAAAGGVGQLLVQLLVAKGTTVVATAGSSEKLEIARRLGAAHLINYAEVPDLAAAVREAAGRGVDVAYDGVGKATFDASLASLRPRGLMVLFGGASGQVPPFDLQRLNAGGSLFVTRPKLADHLGDRSELEWRAREVFEAIAAGSLTIEVGGRYPFDQAAEAYAALEGRRTTGKLILVPSGGDAA
ncbi:quinone oxidoreductase family protein [Intrasporangium calvum]|uniref:Alcohol dehydrogenase zinc-binding domain protein n=1 Tax=Intrasporangium calvum (strain ATCC 23552 / DSM 43043 / JCM 3097 / NBRC 12989 / NCIMB 10167 / NRRL B-3866 / 7 KIP) TaxID=710696 RepID=E6SDF4_INTC7|nr:quinone oxidoreductase [Intrasporangium calvum]ADU47576.1 Alcohol dehydrogenase zinc-binding domain protein [Intrasporangium calvum DSM 43043]AXG12767.1 quinone oxidoreductase [Intrasporangium calvum]